MVRKGGGLHTAGMERKGRQAARSADTTRELLASARALFGKRGYAAVSVGDIVARAGVTKGAIYHHFRDKRALLGAVVAELEGELADEIRTVIADIDDPVDQLQAGCQVSLDRCLDPIARRIVLLDAPAVLGWQEARDIDMAHGLGIMIVVLRRGMTAGSIRRQPARPLAHLFLGATIEAGMLIAHAHDPRAERALVATPLLAWLESLRVPGTRRAVPKRWPKEG